MQSEEVDINFHSVAAHAKVSTVWLYGTKAVLDKGENCYSVLKACEGLVEAAR